MLGGVAAEVYAHSLVGDGWELLEASLVEGAGGVLIEESGE